MINKTKTAVIVAAAALILVSSLSHAADVYFRKTTAAVALPATGGARATLITVNVPAGVWKATAKASPVNFGSQDYVRCVIMAGTVQVNSAATMTGAASGQPAVATITTVGLVSATSGINTFRLQCWHDFHMGGQYVDPDAILLIERVTGTRG